MKELGLTFEHSVKDAVDKSLREKKALVVYCAAEDDTWLENWFGNDIGQTLENKCIALKLRPGSGDFQYFEQICPKVPIPSVCCIVEGKIAAIIDGNDTGHHRSTLMACFNIKVPPATPEIPATNRDIAEFGHRSPTLKEQTAQKAAQMYQESMLKQKKIDQAERERIIRLVKADREEFNAKRRTNLDSGPQVPVNLLDNIHDNIKNTEHLLAKTCTLQIRLLNGHAITHQFPSSTKLDTVRQWVDANRNDGDAPYVFFRSMPREAFVESDELKSLSELQLTPRSAVILKAIENDNKRPRVIDAQGPGLLGKMFNSVSGWWNSGKQPEYDIASRPTSKSALPYLDDSASLASSRYVSPANSPRIKHQLARNPSELSLPSRPVSPNVFQFVNTNDENNDDSDRKTFNGNGVKLEDKKDEFE
ncbi:LANO_0F06216g1_1 [Lachancea nothofagi CBS 11611]|uniref:LANO_0F06216g1_1 n=1 Tax=Lachancea nothofagi CBS 11611 TaxID=1266666 RepID=A0A1G4K8D6_9SACH|nr:LANO_0F06216g1_1 [Lachancea nothofagi CBS 11611]